MTNWNQRNARQPSTTSLTAALLLFFVTLSLTVGWLSSHAGLLRDNTSSLDAIAIWATTD